MKVAAIVYIDVPATPEQYELNVQLGGEPLWDAGIAICEYFEDRPPEIPGRGLADWSLIWPLTDEVKDDLEDVANKFWREESERRRAG